MNEGNKKQMNILLEKMEAWIKAIIINHNSPHVEDYMNMTYRREELIEEFEKQLK